VNKKKDIWVIVGTIAFVLSVFVGAVGFYRSSQRSEANSAPSADLQQRLVGAGETSLGPVMARVTIVEFLDPECEACRAMHPLVKRVLADFDGRVRYVLRYMPLHHNSAFAAAALEAAALQGKYWEALDLLFERQPVWGSHADPKPHLILEYLAEMGLDRARLEEDMRRPDIKERIARDQADGAAAGVRGTPTFFVNGQALSSLGYEPLRDAVDAALKAP
jgi:protein-disulfide isomerase